MNCHHYSRGLFHHMKCVTKQRYWQVLPALSQANQILILPRVSTAWQHPQRRFSRDGFKQPQNAWIRVITGILVAAGSGIVLYDEMKRAVKASKFPVFCPQAFAQSNIESENKLPIYTADDVAKHNSKENKIWVSYKNGVYDITNFVDEHPGGEIILLAAGNSLEPFWLLYQIHQKTEILDLLETFRIGNLAEDDQGIAVKDMSDPFANDPKRHPLLKPSSLKPFNAEPPASLLAANHITPNDVFFVRNHLPVPVIEPETYELEISGDGVKSVTLSLSDLKKFPKHSITATIQCAGNRRSEMIKLKPIKGLNWDAGAISTAKWSGARLIDVLKAAGFDENATTSVKHIQFEGYDLDPAGVPYGASILTEKALNPAGDVILAYEMNDEPIPRDHGFPVRVVVPGIVGARNVKWLNKIILSSEESSSHWQQNDYKGFPPHIDWDTVDFKTAPAIQELPVQSAICEPQDGTTVDRKKPLIIKGYAWSGGGRGIVRVDVSIDKGSYWHTAELESSEIKLHRAWAWTLWKVVIPIPQDKKSGELEICCRAVDSSYNVQPESVSPIWNLRGVLNNSWHYIKIKLSP